jgi:hypothetical protein
VVNRLQGAASPRFIGDSSPCVSLVGVSSTYLDNSSFQATNYQERRNQIVLRLVAEGSVVVMVMAIGWWGMASLGSLTLLSQSDSLTAERGTMYVAGCPVLEPLQKSSTRRDISKGRGCSDGGSTHPMSSRQPGVGVGGQAHGADRHRENKVPPRTSKN